MMTEMRFALIVLFSLPIVAFAQLPEPEPTPAPLPPSKVFYAMENSSLVRPGLASRTVVQRMVDKLIVAVTQKATPKEAWRSLVSPKDVVGIKVSASGGATSGTHPEVVDAIISGLMSAGIPPSRIVVWDKNYGDLIDCGFKTNAATYRLRWMDAATGYDPEAVLTAPLLGKLIWGDSKFGRRDLARKVDLLSGGDQLSSQSFYSRVLSKEVTKVINVPSLQDSVFTGVNGAMASMTLQNVDNWRRFTKDPDYGDPYLAEMYADPIIYDKVVVTIMDGLFMQFAGGPFPNPNFVIENYSLFASRDPVAIDTTARRLIDEQRVLNKLPSIKPLTGYLDSAAYMGIGNSNEMRIDFVRVGVEGFR